MGDRCSGQCCKFFSVGDPKDFAEHAHRSVVEGRITEKERDKLLSMLLYRGLLNGNPLMRSPCKEKQDFGWRNYWHFWTCKHVVEHDDGTASCGDYENRPDMCRSYPNGPVCEFSSCTWDERRPKPTSEKLIPAHRLLGVRHALAVAIKKES